MKKTFILILVLVFALTVIVSGCARNSDADITDNTRDGTLGDGMDVYDGQDLGRDMTNGMDNEGAGLYGNSANDLTPGATTGK